MALLPLPFLQNVRGSKPGTSASGVHFACASAAVLESQAFGAYQMRRDTSQAQPSGARTETPGQIGGVQLDAATPAGHAMQQATHAEVGGPVAAAEGQELKALVTDWLDKKLLPAINAQVGHGHGIAGNLHQMVEKHNCERAMLFVSLTVLQWPGHAGVLLFSISYVCSRNGMT